MIFRDCKVNCYGKKSKKENAQDATTILFG